MRHEYGISMTMNSQFFMEMFPMFVDGFYGDTPLCGDLGFCLAMHQMPQQQILGLGERLWCFRRDLPMHVMHERALFQEVALLCQTRG